MTLAFIHFVTPLLLLGLLAGGIPWLLHLLSSVKAQEVYFPTLRFLRMSMEKTARRRRIQHWLLLMTRTLLLAGLALAVAQPFSDAIGNWAGRAGDAAVIILDNSYSMAARREGDPKTASADDLTRFSKARAEIRSLLDGETKPALCTLTATNNGEPVGVLTSRRDEVRKALDPISIGYVPASLGQRVSDSIDRLKKQPNPQKVIYIFGDLQRNTYEELLNLKALRDNPDVHVLVVNTASKQINNVGISDLEITGRPIVDSKLEFTVTLVNSSAGDRTATVRLVVNGKEVGAPVTKVLAAAGHEGSSTTARIYYSFSQPGPVSGEVRLETKDDLEVDNHRRFALDIGGRVKALVVRGRTESAESGLDPAMMLRFALDPFSGMEGEHPPWPIVPQVTEADQFKEDDLKGMDVVFFCEMNRFTDAQAEAIARFAAGGGTVMFFLGPDIQMDNYNQMFVNNSRVESIKAQGGLFPAKLLPPIGEVGPQAQAIALDNVDIRHPYLENLYKNQADYLSVLVQRHFCLAQSVTPGRTLMRLADGHPLLVEKSFGRGRVVLCTSTSSPKWNNLPTRALFLPLVVRASLLARQDFGRGQMFLAGAQVAIRPSTAGNEQLFDRTKKNTLSITIPSEEEGGQVQMASVPLVPSSTEGWSGTFRDTNRPGVYSWQTSAEGGPSGMFAINANGVESKLEGITAEAFRLALKQRGLDRVYVGSTLAEVQDAARGDAKDRPWIDQVVLVVILLLVFEAIIANRKKLAEESIPQHLNPQTT